MEPSTDRFLHRLRDLLEHVADVIRGQAIDRALEDRLNRTFPADGLAFQAIAAACHEGVDKGHLCQRQAGGIRYGRALEAGEELAGMSVDVVYMNDVVGPHHSHPRGEIDMIIPIADTARFDGRGVGWLVYDPGSEHCPTVTGGDSFILYLLPNGEIHFT